MPDPVRRFFESHIGREATPIYTDRESEERRRLQVAACALLLELAHADDEFTDRERAHVHDVIRREFGLDEDGAHALLAASEAERASGAHMHEFADLISASFDHGEKTRMVELMWALALSDGQVAQHESYLMDRLATLLGLPADELAGARRRVEGRTSK